MLILLRLFILCLYNLLEYNSESYFYQNDVEFFFKTCLFTLKCHYSLYNFFKKTCSETAVSLLSLMTSSLKLCHLIKCGSNLRSSISIDAKLLTKMTLNSIFNGKNFCPKNTFPSFPTNDSICNHYQICPKNEKKLFFQFF